MNASPKMKAAITFALTAAALLVPWTLRAQEEADPSDDPLEKVVPVPKPAVDLGAPFRDGAVLQRDMKVPVWGWAAPGTTVTVEFAGQKKTATAGKDGKWSTELDPLKASFEPAEMKISDNAGKSVTLKNLLVGEVWFASGQSNMQWVASKCDVAQLQKQIEARVKEGKEKAPVIREGKIIDYYAALHPVEHANAEWIDKGGEMSAIAYSFAYHVFREIDVPVGILNCSFSQTSIQSWTPREGFRDGTSDYTKAIYQRILESDPSSPEHKAAWAKYYAGVESQIKDGKEISTKTPGNLDGNRDASWLFNARLNPMIPYAVRGGIWNQGYANIGEGLAYYDNLHSLIRGWRLKWKREDMPVYFNQFYSPGASAVPSIGDMAEMRLGTLMARDIPNTGMAIQIDITGAIHYFNKTLSGQRLALHALKNQYGKKVVADGPLFKAYRVDGDKVIVELENVEGGLLVAETGTNSKTGLGQPTPVPDGDKQVKLFYVADENRVWYPADVRIDGAKAIVSSPKVKSPRGVTYGTGGVGNAPNLYNQAMLPLAPFIAYDGKLVTSKSWPDPKLKVDGETIDPSTLGLKYEYRKMPLLSAQFRDNAVLQAGQPIVFRGSTLHDFGYEAKGKAEVKFSFAGVEKTIPVTPGMKEWQVTVPAMEASAEPKTLTVTFTIDGALAHERVCKNIVIGDVWYVAAPGEKFDVPAAPAAQGGGLVRMMTRKSKDDSSPRPRHYNVCVSNATDSKYGSIWEEAAAVPGWPAALGQRIAAKTGKPVGIIFMQSIAQGKKGPDMSYGPDLKSWFTPEGLEPVPALKRDFEQLMATQPGTKFYAANGQRYLEEWKKYWAEYVPALMSSKGVPDFAPWGKYPSLTAGLKTDATQTYNAMVCPFMPASVKGIIFITGRDMVNADGGEKFGEQFAALANCWKPKFACEDPHFIYTLPGTSLAPNITAPTGIKGKSTAVEIKNWPGGSDVIEAVMKTAYP